MLFFLTLKQFCGSTDKRLHLFLMAMLMAIMKKIEVLYTVVGYQANILANPILTTSQAFC